MTDLYIHIGTHKTGTTTIQHALRTVDNTSQQEGWKYLKTPRIARELMRAEKYDRGLVRNFHTELQDLLRRGESTEFPSPRFVMSSEALSGLATNGYQNSSIVASMLREATKQYEVKLIVYLRRQDDFVESMYTQIIHQGESFSFKEFLTGYEGVDALNYSRMLQDFRIYFGDHNLIVKSYHDASERGLLRDFAEVINSVVLSNASGERKNPSYSPHALNIARVSNPHLDREQKRKLRRALQNVMPKNQAEPFSYFYEEERSIFLEKYAPSNREVADFYFNGELNRMFPPPPIGLSPSCQTNVPPEQVGRLVVELLSSNDTTAQSGIMAGAHVALSGYPKIQNLLRKILRRK